MIIIFEVDLISIIALNCKVTKLLEETTKMFLKLLDFKCNIFNNSCYWDGNQNAYQIEWTVS